MLYEPGPIALFTSAEIPDVQPPLDLAALAAPEVVALEAGAGALVAVGGTFTGAAALDGDDIGGLDLGTAAADLASQADDVSPDLVAAAAGADVLGGDLAGLTGEVSGDISAGVPAVPTVPPGADTGDEPRDPVAIPGTPPDEPREFQEPPIGRVGLGCYGADCAAGYQARLDAFLSDRIGRTATEAERRQVLAYMGTYGYLDDAAFDWIVENWILPNV